MDYKSKLKMFFLKPLIYGSYALWFGYRWHGFFARIILVGISFTLNPYNYAVSQFTTGAMKLFLLTCAILAYAIYKLIFDYTKRGMKRQEAIERLRKSRLVKSR